MFTSSSYFPVIFFADQTVSKTNCAEKYKRNVEVVLVGVVVAIRNNISILHDCFAVGKCKKMIWWFLCQLTTVIFIVRVQRTTVGWEIDYKIFTIWQQHSSIPCFHDSWLNHMFNICQVHLFSFDWENRQRWNKTEGESCSRNKWRKSRFAYELGVSNIASRITTQRL